MMLHHLNLIQRIAALFSEAKEVLRLRGCLAQSQICRTVLVQEFFSSARGDLAKTPKSIGTRKRRCMMGLRGQVEQSCHRKAALWLPCQDCWDSFRDRRLPVLKKSRELCP
jgi:hypothetical protein